MSESCINIVLTTNHTNCLKVNHLMWSYNDERGVFRNTVVLRVCDLCVMMGWGVVGLECVVCGYVEMMVVCSIGEACGCVCGLV